VSIEGVMQVFDERGRHQWSFKKGALAYGSDWIAFSDSGDALLCASDFKPLNVPGGRLTKLGIGGVETNRRLVCLSPAGQVVWEQSVPVELDWSLPRSSAELHEYWQRRFGFRDSQHLNGPVIGPDGTIFVLGSTVRSLNKLYAIRGD
jgi:outer membrane protein assembly factor BamB